MNYRTGTTTVAIALSILSAAAMASDGEHAPASGAPACVGFGPQTPRDIDSLGGSNKRVVVKSPKASEMNLCNIHFHKNAEHKAKAFAIYAGDGDGHGFESGYQCGMSKDLSKSELMPASAPVCKSDHGELKPGDTIEVHWVYTSCDIKARDVKSGAGLGACLTKSCANPQLRVEAQVFTLVNDGHALDFSELDFEGNSVNGFLQPNALPKNTGTPVEFIGSTTGPNYSEQACSPLAVTWSVRPQCAKLNINTVAEWCKGNAYGEDHAHGVRKLVTNRKLLSQISGTQAAPAAKPSSPPAAKAAAPAAPATKPATKDTLQQ
jgi:hypothetical protein